MLAQVGFYAASVCNGGAWPCRANITAILGNEAVYGTGWAEKTIAYQKYGCPAAAKLLAKLPAKLPATEQLLAVSVHSGSYDAGVPRKGAVPAAGCSRPPHTLWTGDIRYDAIFSMQANSISLQKGYASAGFTSGNVAFMA